MSREYAMSRVKDALEKSEGNTLKAQRLLLQWIEKDQNLLFGLVGPHLQSIVAHAVNHIGKEKPAAKAPAKKAATAAKDKNEFGSAMLKTMQGETAAFGQPDGMVPRPGSASQKHIDTMRALAAAQKGKSGGDGRKK
jgi:hypothetical protein